MDIPNLIIGFFVGISANLLTPLIQKTLQSRFERRARSVANKSLSELQQEYERVKKLRNEPNFLYVTFASQTLHAISSIFLVILILSISFAFALIVSIQFNFGLFPYVAVAAIGILFGHTGFRAVSERTLDIYRVINFNTYEPDVRKRIEELKRVAGSGQ